MLSPVLLFVSLKSTVLNFGPDPSEETVLVNVTKITSLMLNPMASPSSSFDPVNHVLFLDTFSSFGFQKTILFGFPPRHSHSFSFFFADSSSTPQPLNVTAPQSSVPGLPFSLSILLP